MTLQEQLNAFKERVESCTTPDSLSPEAITVMHRATDELRVSGITDHVLKAGDRAPDFTLPNAKGEGVSSKDLLSRGPLVVSFFRGVW